MIDQLHKQVADLEQDVYELQEQIPDKPSIIKIVQSVISASRDGKFADVTKVRKIAYSKGWLPEEFEAEVKRLMDIWGVSRQNLP